MSIRVRFAPSPTGQVHIGNIRTAIFNYLFARHNKGEFLLRIEDTDLERSTPEAIEKLYECMEYLKLDYDGTVMYQSKQSGRHVEAAKLLLDAGLAYLGRADESGKQPLFFQIPLNFDEFPMIRKVGASEMLLHVESPVEVSWSGVSYSTLSSKSKAMPQQSALAGLKDGRYYGVSGELLFDTTANIDELREGRSFKIENAFRVEFTRHEVIYTDLIKGEMAKPIEGMKDQIILRSDGTPVFHLANVVDDITQEITHIVRGDDHVENTYRHVLLFAALKHIPPSYAHLPMIVNSSGKPYSKRDGDAFVGDFKNKGFMAEALFNYLSLLGWSPGDDREKMSKAELIEAFTFERVKSSPAQLAMNKLMNLNGQYISEMPFADFEQKAKEFYERGGGDGFAADKFREVAMLMQNRTKTFMQVESWRYFFVDDFEYDPKSSLKIFSNEDTRNALHIIAEKLDALKPYTPSAILEQIEKVEAEHNMQHGKLFQPIRLAMTGVSGGADLDKTLALIGPCARERVAKALAPYEG